MAAPSQISPVIAIPLTFMSACLLAEFFGYWLHRLLHSDRIPLLSRGHLIHHFLIYGPGQPMRLEKYHDATEHRFSVGNIGLEWLVPSAMILAVAFSLGVRRLPSAEKTAAWIGPGRTCPAGSTET